MFVIRCRMHPNPLYILIDTIWLICAFALIWYDMYIRIDTIWYVYSHWYDITSVFALIWYDVYIRIDMIWYVRIGMYIRINTIWYVHSHRASPPPCSHPYRHARYVWSAIHCFIMHALQCMMHANLLPDTIQYMFNSHRVWHTRKPASYFSSAMIIIIYIHV